MVAEVVRPFWDAKDPAKAMYRPGDRFEGSAARVAELEAGGFVKRTEPEQKQEKAAPKARAKKAAPKAE